GGGGGNIVGGRQARAPTAFRGIYPRDRASAPAPAPAPRPATASSGIAPTSRPEAVWADGRGLLLPARLHHRAPRGPRRRAATARPRGAGARRWGRAARGELLHPAEPRARRGRRARRASGRAVRSAVAAPTATGCSAARSAAGDAASGARRRRHRESGTSSGHGEQGGRGGRGRRHRGGPGAWNGRRRRLHFRRLAADGDSAAAGQGAGLRGRPYLSRALLGGGRWARHVRRGGSADNGGKLQPVVPAAYDGVPVLPGPSPG